jgi:hypothetical protein
VVTGTLLVDPRLEQPYRRVTVGLDDGHEAACCGRAASGSAS